MVEKRSLAGAEEAWWREESEREKIGKFNPIVMATSPRDTSERRFVAAQATKCKMDRGERSTITIILHRVGEKR